MFRNKYGYIKKRAFTLAEILITLGIIGVVAALTLPGLITNVQKTIALTQVKRVYAILSATTNMAAVDHGDPSVWDMGTGTGASVARAKYFVETYMLPYLKVAEVCENNNTPNCKYTMRALNGSIYTNGLSNTYRFYLQDGAFVMVWANQATCKKCHQKQVTIFYDVNGKKGVNTIGHDVFKLEYLIESDKYNDSSFYVGKILPQYANRSRQELLNGGSNMNNEECNKNKLGVACLALIINDGWTFAPDYPW